MRLRENELNDRCSPPTAQPFIIAIDHPARGMVGVSGQPFVMADRRDVLERTMTALADPGRRRGHGHAGHSRRPRAARSARRQGHDRVDQPWWPDGVSLGARRPTDRRTPPEAIVEQDLDGAKMLLRIDLNDARAAVQRSKPAPRGSPSSPPPAKLAMLEPLPYTTRCPRGARRSTPTMTRSSAVWASRTRWAPPRRTPGSNFPLPPRSSG